MLERDGVWPSRVIVRAEDARGRTLEAVGEVVNRMGFQNLPSMMNLVGLVRWEYEGSAGAAVEAWGEFEDVWDVDLYRRFAREQRLSNSYTLYGVEAQDADDQGFAPLPLVDRRSSGDLVAVHIRSMIFNGELRQGDRVRQDEIARHLGMSRIPVREAIIALDREGWLTITPHRGAFVHGLDEDALRDHYELLGLVYGLAARRATERATDDELERLRDAQQQLAAADSPDTMHDANNEFLRTLLILARSPRLGSVMRNMSTVVPGNFFELISGSAAIQQAGTKRIVAAMKRRDPDAAAGACMRLLREQGDLVIKLLASRGMFAAVE